ncbi:hypothetical protein WMY93_026525 [Mugilogobius chulae]|uniref:DH domain-containing protein n=1 Tax=Mugilogobius chulae TaxID=88201 RepID=A0AAW0MYQ9_9GOBI
MALKKVKAKRGGTHHSVRAHRETHRDVQTRTETHARELRTGAGESEEKPNMIEENKMDTAKTNSLSRAPPHMNGLVNGSSLDDVVDSRSSEGERQRDSEGKEETPPAAEITLHHRRSAESHKKFYSYQRRPKGKVVTDFSTVSKGTSSSAKPRAALRQVQVLFNQSEKNSSLEANGQLDLLKHNLEAFTVPVRPSWKWAEENQALERHWTDIVHSAPQMTKMQKNQQDALWEFVSTELIYINKLLVIRDLVLESLQHLHQLGFLLEVSAQLLFSNLPSVISAHQLFWQEVLFPMLQEVRRTGAPFDPMRLELAVCRSASAFRKRFSSYKHYCWEEESTQEFARRQQESSPHFHAYVQWIESHSHAERMRLGDMQAKPHQRITKYPLLLGAILKNTSQPGVQQALRAMLSSVMRFLESINDYMRFKDEELALSISAENVEGFQVDGINEEIDKCVREVSTFDLTCPVSGVGPEVIRRLLLEENLKIRWRKDNKMEIVALLFSDVLLLTKAQKKGERLKVIRPPLALDRTHCIALKDGCSFVLVEVGELLCVMNVFIFVASTPNSCSTWVSTIQQAKETLKEMRDKETSRQMEKWKLLQHYKSQSEVNDYEAETEAPPMTPSEEDPFEENLPEEKTEPKQGNGPQSPQSANGPQGPQPQPPQTVNGPQSPQRVNGPQSPQTVNRLQSPQRVNGPQSPQTINGPQSPQTTKEPQSPKTVNGPQSPQTVNGVDYTLFNGEMPFWQSSSPPQGLYRKQARRSLPARHPVIPGYEFIEMQVRSQESEMSSETVNKSPGARGMNAKRCFLLLIWGNTLSTHGHAACSIQKWTIP